jgi:hypothetical protein
MVFDKIPNIDGVVYQKGQIDQGLDSLCNN